MTHHQIPTGWKKLKIGDVTISSAFGPRFSSDLYSKNGNIATLRTTDIDENGRISIEDMPLANLNIQTFKKHFLKKGDIVISRSGTIGVTAIFEGSHLSVIPGAFLIRFRFNKDYFLPSYAIFYFLSKIGKTQLINSAGGGVQKNLKGSAVLSLKISLPPLPEQHRIVTVLETWDKAIEKLTRKIKLKKNIKKGLMQKLLTGKVRLSGFDGGWETVKLGDAGEIVTGNTPPKNDIENYGEDFYWATAEDFSQKYISDTKVKLSKKGKKISRQLPAGALLITCIASIGKNAIAKTPLSTNQQINSIIFGDHHSNEFFYYLISFKKNKLLNEAGSGAVKLLSKSSFSSLTFKVPRIKEQTAIANILTTADEEIETLQKKKQLLEQQKKYLLNNLITGKIRTPENLMTRNT